MAWRLTTDADLAAVADSIRAKAEITGPLTYPDEFVQAIDGIYTGVDTTDATAVAADIRNGKTAYVNEQKVTGTMTEKAAATYNVSISNQTIAANQYLTGAQTIRKVTTANIAAGNIKSGITIKVGDEGDAGRIASVSGTFTASNTVSSGQTAAAAGQILSGYSAWVNGAEIKGSIGSKAAATYNASTSDQTIAAGQYLSGAQTIRKVTTANISAGNIKSGVTVTVGDSDNASRIASVAGTFTAANTVSSGQTAAAAGQILSGYSAWVGGSEVKGSIATKTSANMTVSGATVTAPAGYYASSSSKSVASGSATTPATTITVAPSISIDSAGKITATNSGSKNVTPTVSAGYVSSGTAGKITVDGSNTKQMTVKAATTYNASTSDQTIAAGTYLTGAQTIRKITTSNISADNIKEGVTIKVGDSGSATRIANVTGTVKEARQLQAYVSVSSVKMYKGNCTVSGNSYRMVGPTAATTDSNPFYLQSGDVIFGWVSETTTRGQWFIVRGSTYYTNIGISNGHTINVMNSYGMIKVL